MTPIVTVIIPSFNHEAFILRTIDSVLSQTFQELEILIVDDGSTDRSAELIRSIANPRVRSIIFEKNMGSCAATDTGIRESSAPYIAICSSDDEWVSTKIATQLELLQANPSVGAVFSNASWIDDHGNSTNPDQLSPDIFRQPNRSRQDWLRDLVEFCNCLCCPSVLIRREVFEQCGVFDNRYRQLPDYDMWLRVLEKFQILVMDQELVRFRVRNDRQNTSSVVLDNLARHMNEWAIILRRFFRRLDASNFAGSFGTIKPPAHADFSLPIEVALYLATRTRTNETMFRSIGMDILHDYLNNDAGSSAALDSYGLPKDAFHIMMGLSSPWGYRQATDALTAKESSFLTRVRSDLVLNYG